MHKKSKLFLIGASTGGPGHIQKILKNINIDLDASYVIVQHMSCSHMKSFVIQLDSISPIPVVQSMDKMKIEPFKIYICSRNFEFNIYNDEVYLKEVENNTPFIPSIDLLFSSASIIIHRYNIVSIILTGIGDDGAKSSKILHDLGAVCIAESEKTAIVYGMPKQTFIQNINVEILTLDAIILYIKEY